MNDYFWSLVDVALKTVVVGLVGVLFGFLFKEKFKSIIKYSVKHIYDKKLEDYKKEEVVRQKAILIADLLSEWMTRPIGSKDRKRLNQLSLEAFILLPKDIAEMLSKRLLNEDDAVNSRNIAAEVRKLILGANEVIDPSDIILFPSDD